MELTIEQALQKAMAAHNEGNLQDAERYYQDILQSNPMHPDANHNLGALAGSVNKFDVGLPLFKKALDANPKNPQFWLSYINALIQEKQFDNAMLFIDQAKNLGIAREPLNALEEQLASTNASVNANSSTPSEEQLSSLLDDYQNERYGDAERLARSLSTQFPRHNFSWKILAILLKKAGNNAEAILAGQKAVEINPYDVEGHFNLGNTFKGLGRLEEAVASFTQAIVLEPDFFQAHSNLGIAQQEMGRLVEAEVSNTKALLLEPNFAEAHYNLGNTFKEMGRLDEAEASYLQAISLKPDFAEAHGNLGNIFETTGRLDEAIESCTQAIALKIATAEAHYNLGVMLNKADRLVEAEASYRQAVSLNPTYPRAHNNLGDTLYKMRRFEEAEKSYKQAIIFKPDFAEAHSNLGVVLQEMERFDEAEATYMRAIELKPDFFHAHNNLGSVLKELDRLEEAEALLTKAITLKPDSAEAYSNLGTVMYLNGAKVSGLENLKKANNIDPNLLGNQIMLAILQARNTLGRTKVETDNINDLEFRLAQSQSPLILKRRVEAALIPCLYSMTSVDVEKFENSRNNDPRYGNGKCSQDFNLFKADSPIIKSVAEDLIIMMRDVVKSDIFVSESFFNIFGAGGGIIPHTHLGSLDKNKSLNFAAQKYSLVYYLSVGDQNCTDPGILKLYDPSEELLPYDGMIAVFPAGRSHSSIYSGTKDRIIIGVNFYSL